MKFRGITGLCAPITRKEAIAVARATYKQELAYIATSFAWGMKQINLPPSITIKLLREFNNKIDEFRDDNDIFVKTQELLNKDTAMNEALKNFLKKDEDEE